MSQPSIADNDSSRRSRTRRRETMLNAVATILGCLALVVMIATVVRVVMVKLWESAKVNPEYVQSIYDNAHERESKAGTYSASQSALEELPPSYKLDEAPPAGAISLKDTPPSNSSLSPTAHKTESPLRLTAARQEHSGILQIDKKRQKIEDTLRGFFSSPTVESKLAFVRDEQRVRPMMEQFHREHTVTRQDWKGLGWVLSVEEPGFRLGYAEATFTDAEPVILTIEEQEDETFRVDWESSVRYGELAWSEFIRTQPTTPKLFRLIASRPRHAFSKESSIEVSQMLEVRHPDDDHVIQVYFDRLDPKFQSLLQQMETGNWKDVYP